MVTAATQSGVVETHIYWCVTHRMVLTAADIVWRRMLRQRDGENDGGSGGGLIAGTGRLCV
jgi:glycerol-3-phosphate dehydrogenase